MFFVAIHVHSTAVYGRTVNFHLASFVTMQPPGQHGLLPNKLPALDDATELTFTTHFEGTVFCPLQGLLQLLLIPFANSLLTICTLQETALECRNQGR